MRNRKLVATQTIPLPRDDVFAFFATPRHLEAITPPWLRFRIADQTTEAVRENTRFTYRLRLHGIPITWVSRITDWVPGERFVDEQIRGPYALWRHTHTFEVVAGGTLVRDRVVYRLPLSPLTRLLQVGELEEEHPERGLTGHVIIAGYGLAGQELARSLEHCGIPYLVVDLNVDNVRQANRDGVRAYFGDVTSPEVLEHLGIATAEELVLAVNDPDAALRAVRTARQLSGRLLILVRTAYLEDAARLLDAGASRVVAADVESAVSIVHQILVDHGADLPTVKQQLGRVRSCRADPAP